MWNKKKILHLFLDDWVAKVLCLVLAIVLYVFYQFSNLRDRPISVPVTLISSENLVPASQYPRTVRLLLRGESDEIYAIHESDLEAVIDLGVHTVPGTWRVPVKILKRGSALAAEPLTISVEPSEISIILETKFTRQLEIIPEFRGLVENGFEVVGFEVVPGTIDAVGPTSVVEGIQQAFTEAIDLTGRDENFAVRVRVLKADSVIHYATSEFVEVKVAISRELVFRTISAVSVETRNLSSGLSLESGLPFVTLRISGSRKKLEDFVPESLVAYIDLSAITQPGEYALPVQLVLPESLELDTVDPPLLNITLLGSGSDGGGQ
ncbi:MAG: hypothetical protein KKI09_13430 [Spirochaetes bacterium]|nr:hypothetical protein [Spirochaetota bacterium]MBU0956426.1 hypothetical protein [Spirochaetota bacterium]